MNHDEKLSKFLADASALVALGAVAGVALGKIFHSGMDDAQLGFYGSVAGFVVTLAWTALNRSKQALADMLESLAVADDLFIGGVINEDEWQRLRLFGIGVLRNV